MDHNSTDTPQPSYDKANSKSPSRRRNGQQAACEPCRRAKLRCDHAPPVCSRCRKRRTPTQCVILAAPMTKSKRTAEAASKLPSHTLVQVSSPASCVEIRRIGSHHESKLSSESSGFLGPTSFSATVQHDSLAEEPKVVSDSNPEKPVQLRLGVQVLMQLPGEEACQSLLEWYLDNVVVVGAHKLSRRLTLKALWLSYGHLLRGQRNKVDLEIVVKELLRNESIPLKQIDDPMEWIASFSGANTRWEVIGLLFSAFAYALLSWPEKHLPLTFGEKGGDRNALVAEMKSCIDACIELCRDSLNSLVCNLLYWNVLLETVLSGDSSLSAWRLHKDLVGTTIALGLHCYQGASEVTLHSEQTKTLSACIFWSDKELSLFTGRPPSLSRRYYSCPLPLDLNDETLVCGGAELEREIGSLDQNGWNTQGRIFEATIVRMMLVFAFIQDEIMEMFLGNQEQWSLQRLDELKSRTRDSYSKFPKQLQVSKTDLIACKDDQLMWRLMMARFDYLRINFLLERLSSERGGASKRKLLEAAREMLDLTVFLWLERDRSANRKHDYDYIIMSYGIPCIGILCTEFLKQVKNPNEVEVKLPCSEIVQNLSMIIGFLDWVRPAAGNYKLCCRMSRVIRRVLDHILEPAPEHGIRDTGILLEMPDGIWPVDGLDDLDWLNSIDWTWGPFDNLDR
ncbi:uncharacterized protein PAC_19993 [Phialocephala subalpina]|uniref:Zn(2)-C6 fungal-type domain-containing protein n=1 Tax=Phialocephala subalpina TaxID=576137 RepID=A0A1L7XYD9_9HELO|nr:uncharacterized protein PAC_19993 [Phialocephala subalpina]